MKKITRFASLGFEAVSRAEQKVIRGGFELPGDGPIDSSGGACGTENSYTCTVTFPGGGSVSGTGCGSSPSEAAYRAGGANPGTTITCS